METMANPGRFLIKMCRVMRNNFIKVLVLMTWMPMLMLMMAHTKTHGSTTCTVGLLLNQVVLIRTFVEA